MHQRRFAGKLNRTSWKCFQNNSIDFIRKVEGILTMLSKRNYIILMTLGLFACIVLFGCYSSEQLQPMMDKVATNSLGMQMLPIPSGFFEMGNPDPGIQDWDEVPMHGVTISGFSMSETEVTIEQYRQFMPEFAGSQLEYPYVVGVSWEDATTFCEWLSEREGVTYRLPTEAEWEYACRAGTSTPYWSGEEPPKQETPNPWGLKNMHSGPREWCYDWYGLYSYEDMVDPVGVDGGIARVIRGGGDEGRAYYGRSFNRSGYGPGFRRRVDDVELLSRVEYADDDLPPGFAGLWYGRLNFERVRGYEVYTDLDIDFKALGRISNTWAGRYSGSRRSR